MDIINIIDRLEALITTSTKVPATQRTLLDVNKVQELMDQLRLAVPQDVRAAKEILVNKDDIINLAEAERRRTKAQAEEEFQNRTNQSEVLKEAQRRARQIVEDAERKSARMISQAETELKTSRAEVDAYAAKALRNLERQLTANLTSVRNGLALLTGVETFEVLAENGSRHDG